MRRRYPILIMTAFFCDRSLLVDIVIRHFPLAKNYPGLDKIKPITIKFNTYMTSKHGGLSKP